MFSNFSALTTIKFKERRLEVFHYWSNYCPDCGSNSWSVIQNSINIFYLKDNSSCTYFYRYLIYQTILSIRVLMKSSICGKDSINIEHIRWLIKRLSAKCSSKSSMLFLDSILTVKYATATFESLVPNQPLDRLPDFGVLPGMLFIVKTCIGPSRPTCQSVSILQTLSVRLQGSLISGKHPA